MQNEPGNRLMSTRDFSIGELYIDHEPDYTSEKDQNDQSVVTELPGFVEIGIVIDGVKVPLTRRKAGSLLPAIDKAKADAKAAAEAAPPAPPAS